MFIGVNAVDYSGYPDCRPEFIAAFEAMANLATRAGVEGRRLTIHTPLIDLTKGEIVRRGLELGVDYAATSTCYDPAPDGGACGRCDACLLRAQGLRRGRASPTRPATRGRRPGLTGRVTYLVKEAFLTLQGEGAHTGRPAVFCRFSGCNLWTGREEHRATWRCAGSATRTSWAPTARAAAPSAAPTPSPGHLRSLWPDDGPGFVVCTGGEPTLQLDDELVEALHRARLRGRRRDQRDPPRARRGRLGVPQPQGRGGGGARAGRRAEAGRPPGRAGGPPEAWASFPARVRSLQPMDGPDRAANTATAVAYCLAHPEWRLSVQTHKDLGIP